MTTSTIKGTNITAYLAHAEPGLFKPICIVPRDGYGLSLNVYFTGTADDVNEIVGVTVHDNDGDLVGAVGLVPTEA